MDRSIPLHDMGAYFD